MFEKTLRHIFAQKGHAHNSGSRGDRLEPLDGMRGVAILLVLFFHYFQRFPEYYPYGAQLFPLAGRGYLGVHLFFIISGFVISLTVGKKPSIANFAVGRIVRLWPAMLVCSILTFVIIHAGDTDFANIRRVDWTGFLPSLTFTPPIIWRPVVGETAWIDGAYWSLFVEVRFYFWIALAYLLFGRARILRAMVVLMILNSTLIYMFESLRPASQLPRLVDLLFFTNYLPLFLIGMVCYQVYLGERSRVNFVTFAVSLALAMIKCKDIVEAIFVFLAAMWFLYFSLRKTGPIINIFATPVLVFFGAISYSLYLLHQNIGVFLITLLPKGLNLPVYLFLVALIIGLVAAMAYLVFRGVERPIQVFWRSIQQRSSLRRVARVD